MEKTKLPHLKWQRLPGHRNLRGRAGHTASLVGKQIFVLGGRNGNEFLNDMWAFDTEIEQWKLVQAKVPFSPRAYHTTTVVNEHELWVIGGSDHSTMYADVHVFNTISSKWSSPVTFGPLSNKQRGTHAAVLHPLQRDAILVYGGYGGVESCWMNDLVILHTDTLEWEELKPEGTRPSGRGYHTLTAFGTCVALFGGKAEGGILKDGKLSIYDAVKNRWNIPIVKGESPSPRSNHAAALLEDNLIVIYGGRHGSLRLSDAYVLQISPVVCHVANLELRWHVIERTKNVSIPKKTTGRRGPEAAKMVSPSGRSAHSLISKGHALYVFGGYGGQGLTFDDIFVLRKLPRLPELENMKQPPFKMSNGQILIEVGEETEEEAEEGWRSTKRPKLHIVNQEDCLPESPGAVNVPGNILQEKLDMRFVKEASDTRSTEQMTEAHVHVEKRPVSSLEDRSLAMSAREKKLYQKEVSTLQQSVEFLKATIKEKTLTESELREGKIQVEQEAQRLQKENLDLRRVVEVLEKEITLSNQKSRNLEVEDKTLKANVQALRLELEEKENERHEAVLMGSEHEKKSKELMQSLEDIKSFASEVVHERDKYKACVQKLETELEKQMEALQQVSSRYETEKAFLLKEVAERKGTADRILTELGASKECARTLEEALKHQASQIDQEAAKVDLLRKEKEALNRSNAVMASECKQLVEAKEVAEANCVLVRSELQAARSLIEQNGAEIVRLKDMAEQTKEHISSLHVSLKKNEETLKAQLEENERFRTLIRETEEFEQAQARLIQSHAEKMRCARQSCPY